MNESDDDQPLLIVNADDFALTERVSRGILEAHQHGVVTSTSVLAVTPAFRRSISMLRDVPTIGVGVHLAVVGEDPPLLSAREIPTLVDERGRLFHSWKTFLPRAAAGRIDPDDVRREFTAQFEAVASEGFAVDHLDTHQNLHLWPLVREAILDLGDRFEVRRIRVTRSRRWGPIGITVRTLANRLESRLVERGWVWPQASTGLDEAGAIGLGEMVKAVGRLAASDAPSAELATHPGLPEDVERDRYRWDYQWASEYNALCSETVRIAIDELGFRLGTFAALPEPA